jgi:hypothetical protein
VAGDIFLFSSFVIRFLRFHTPGFGVPHIIIFTSDFHFTFFLTLSMVMFLLLLFGFNYIPINTMMMTMTMTMMITMMMVVVAGRYPRRARRLWNPSRRCGDALAKF